MKSFGLGEYLNNDLSVGKKGIIPDFDFYNKWYPDFKWGATTTLSNNFRDFLIRSMWPKVIGSKVPGYTTTLFIIVSYHQFLLLKQLFHRQII